MTDLNPLSDPNPTPEDVATLYSWANLHGAKYRDFSAARAQTREKARLRAEQALEEQRARNEAEPPSPSGPALVLPAGEVLPRAEVLPPTAAAPAAQANAEPGPDAHDAHFNVATEPIHQPAPEIARGFGSEPPYPEPPYAEPSFHDSDPPEQTNPEAHSYPAPESEEDAQKAAADAAEKARLTAVHAQQEAERAQQEARRAAEYAAHLAAEQAAHRAAAQAAEEAAKAAAAREAERHAQEAAEREAQAAQERAREHEARLAAQHAAEVAAAHAREEAAERAAREAAAREQEKVAQQRPPQNSHPGAFPTYAPSTPVVAQSTAQRGREYAGYGQPQAFRPSPSEPQFQSRREESSMPAHTPWADPDTQEPVGRPAWLSETEAPAQSTFQSSPSAVHGSSLPGTPDDTLQGSRDRLTSRWYALRGIFDGSPAPADPTPPPVVSRAPATAVFSLAGGVGKTSLVATLGRALSARGERVLLVDTAAFGLLPFFFGAMDQRPGVLRTFNPPGMSSDAPIQMVTIDPDGLSSDTAGQESLSGEIAKFSRGVSRVIVDLATASGATTRRILRMAPLVLVPVIPDMNSVVSVSSIDAFFEHNSNPSGKPSMPFYVLNQFDASLPLHLDVREVLREQLGDRLLPFALRRTPAMSEALAEGMTVLDYAPGSALAEDFSTLAGWVKSLSAPATTSYRGVRWSER